MFWEIRLPVSLDSLAIRLTPVGDGVPTLLACSTCKTLEYQQFHVNGSTCFAIHLFKLFDSVCHNVAVMCLGTWRPNINAKSGLFTKRCQNCRSELKTGSLHALILTAFHVANSCLPGENLFGMIACLVCLLVYRVDPCDTAEISIPALFGHR